MEILDPDLWNDDGTPKRPSKEYMQRLGENPVLQQFTEGLVEVAESMTEVVASDKPVISVGETYLNYARIKREAKEQRGPEVGDIVHYWDEEKALCRAAMVMETDSFNHNAELRVHIPREAYADAYAVHDEHVEGAGEGTWHWPCGEGR